MRFLADESCDFAVVQALRKVGYDVVAVAEISPRAEDLDVVHLAIREGRILLTEDKDFGQLFFASSEKPVGLVFVRYPSQARETLPQDMVRLANRHGRKLKGCFVVLQPGRVRISQVSR